MKSTRIAWDIASKRITGHCVRRSPFDHADWPKSRDLLRQPRLVHDVDDGVDVLVGVGLLLRQLAAAARARDDAHRFELAIDLPPLRLLHRRGAAHSPPRAVAGRA